MRVMMKKQGTGKPPEYLYRNDTNDRPQWVHSGSGTTSVITNSYEKTWIELSRASGGSSTSSTVSLPGPIDPDKDYNLSFYHSNVNSYNYVNMVFVGPFYMRHHRDRDNIFGLHVSGMDTWNGWGTQQIGISAVTSHVSSVNFFYELDYRGVNPGTPTHANITVRINGSYIGGIQVLKTDVAAATGVYLLSNGDVQRISTIVLEQL